MLACGGVGSGRGRGVGRECGGAEEGKKTELNEQMKKDGHERFIRDEP